jgi:hypothetical protein
MMGDIMFYADRDIISRAYWLWLQPRTASGTPLSRLPLIDLLVVEGYRDWLWVT